VLENGHVLSDNLYFVCLFVRALDSVGLTSGHRLDARGIVLRFPAGAQIYHFTKMSRLGVGLAEPSVQCVPWDFNPWEGGIVLNRRGRVADHPVPRVSEWSCICTPPYAFTEHTRTAVTQWNKVLLEKLIVSQTPCSL